MRSLMRYASLRKSSDSAQPNARGRAVRILRWGLLTTAAIFYALHFVHLTADFPNNSPWDDWSKYTDEGWYSDAAIRHFLLGRWYLPGDFNPAVVMPVLPLLEAAVFGFTGVSLAAARALTVAVFGVMLIALYLLIQRCEAELGDSPRSSLAAPVAILFLCTSPFFFVFDRLAILEPLLAALGVLTLLTAMYLRPWQECRDGMISRLRAVFFAVALGVLIAAMVLTKPTAIALFPAVAFVMWHRARYRLRTALTMSLVPALIAGGLWVGYYVLLVRPHYREDYEYLFTANAYTGFQLEPLARVLFNTAADGRWMGVVLYTAFCVAMIVFAVARLRFFRNPLVPAFLAWIGGYLLFLAYHNNLQPRYYLLLALPVTALTAMALNEFCHSASAQSTERARVVRWCVVAACVLAITVPDAWQQIGFLLHPEYTYEAAAKAIAAIVRADKAQSPLILSISGSDLTLMTGLPSIDDDFGTLDLDQRVKLYRPGWYVAWNEIDDDKMDALEPLYHPVRVAEFPAMDDPDRNLLILYRLDPAAAPPAVPRPGRHIPRPLRTRMGQQPALRQLQH